MAEKSDSTSDFIFFLILTITREKLFWLPLAPEKVSVFVIVIVFVFVFVIVFVFCICNCFRLSKNYVYGIQLKRYYQH